jgi:DNA-binding response OmpR family regulator
MHVLVVEDERKMASLIRHALEAENFAIDVLHSGEEALAAVLRTRFDAIVLDIMLPGRDGLSVLRELRERHNSVPVLLLSARGQVDERIDGLNAGADDYLAKPFSLGELAARVRALARRAHADPRPTVLSLANLTVDTISREVKRDDKRIDLSTREYRLLDFLLASQRRVSGRMHIHEKVWDYHFDPGTNLVDVYVRRLRDKIDAGFEPKLVHTVRGVGYVMKVVS